MTNNLEYLEMIKEAEQSRTDKTFYQENLEYRKAKALEIIAEELCIANKKLTILVMGKLTVKKNKIKVSKIKYEFPPIEVECSKGFTKKVMDEIKKGSK